MQSIMQMYLSVHHIWKRVVNYGDRVDSLSDKEIHLHTYSKRRKNSSARMFWSCCCKIVWPHIMMINSLTYWRTGTLAFSSNCKQLVEVSFRCNTVYSDCGIESPVLPNTKQMLGDSETYSMVVSHICITLQTKEHIDMYIHVLQ